MTLIGVTGSFCTGKTTVSKFFGKLGARVIDADKIVHRLYSKDKKVKRAILKKFGRVVFTGGGQLDRRKLGRLAFSNRTNLTKLEGIIHPEVLKKIKEATRFSKKSIVIIDAPLLIESNLHKAADYIVVVKAALARQIERAIRRGFKKEDCLARRKLQMPLSKKIKYADFVIDNNRSREYTKRQVLKAWKTLTRR